MFADKLLAARVPGMVRIPVTIPSERRGVVMMARANLVFLHNFPYNLPFCDITLTYGAILAFTSKPIVTE